MAADTSLAEKSPKAPWRYALCFGFLLGVFSLGFAAWSMRPLSQDGANFVHGLFTAHWFVRDALFWRFNDFIPQAPTILLLQIFGSSIMLTARTLLYFSYSWISPAGIAVALWLCHHYKKPGLILGPLLSFGFICLPSTPFALSVLPNSLAVFWPIFLLQTYGGRKGRSLIAFLALSLFLALGHETSVALTAALCVFAILGRNYVAAAVNFVSTAAYLARLTKTDDKLFDTFAKFYSPALSNGWLFLFLVCASLCLFALLARLQNFRAKQALLTFLTASIVVFLAVFALQTAQVSYASLNFRAVAAPLLTLIALFTWLLDTELWFPLLNHATAPMTANAKKFLYLVTLCALVIGARNDLRVTLEWNEGVKVLREFVAGRNGEKCIEVPRALYENSMAGRGIADFCLPHLWILLQPTNVVNEFLWINPRVDEGRAGYDPCKHLQDAKGTILTPFRGPELNVMGQGRDFNYRFLESSDGLPGSVK